MGAGWTASTKSRRRCAEEYVGPDGRNPVIKHIIASTGSDAADHQRNLRRPRRHIGEVDDGDAMARKERSMKVNTVDMANEWRKRIGQIVGARN